MEENKYPFIDEEFSFDWYQTRDDKFFDYLTKSFMYADLDNLEKLNSIFPHIGDARRAFSWSFKPKSNNLPIKNKKKKDFEVIRPENSKYNQGSFNRYLFFSGSFVTNISNTILYADNDNLKLIKKVYPQMVAAFKLDDWEMCPKGFTSPSYNSTLK